MKGNKMDIGFLAEEPVFNTKLKLTITPLAPLSMVSELPGSYYHSNLMPTENMIFGLIENMIYFHFSDEIRNSIIKAVKKAAKKKKWETTDFHSSGSKYKSIFQKHIRITDIKTPEKKVVFQDLWSQHLKRADDGHYNGSRNYDWRLENSYDKLTEKQRIRYYPYYYISPTNREYIIYNETIIVLIETKKEINDVLLGYSQNPAAPLYLGSNDGWVEVNAEALDE